MNRNRTSLRLLVASILSAIIKKIYFSRKHEHTDILIQFVWPLGKPLVKKT